jgi:Protein of unknown function (DUF3429)
MTDTTPSTVPTWATWLGYAGLLPFVAGAGWILVAAPDQRGEAARVLLAYGATITSFLGAIHWGLAMRSAQDRAWAGDYIWGVVPSLVAWCALLAGAAIGLPLLVVLLWVCYVVDRKRYPNHGVGHWLPMRHRLTLVASLSCLVAAVTVLAA